MGQENTARIKLKNKLTKRLLPVEILTGKISEGDRIFKNNVEIGRVLIDEEYPFALVKYLNNKIGKNQIFKSDNGLIKILVPNWLKI